MSPRRTGALLGLAALAGVALLWWQGHAASASTAAAGERSSAVTVDPARASTADASTIDAGLRNDPQRVLREGSLRGTVPDGGVSIGFGGHLKPDLELRHLFDYYLAMLGETSLDGIRLLLHEDLQRRQLDEPLIEEVMRTFDRYVRYQQAVVALSGPSSMTLTERFQQMDALRRQILGDELTNAFYGDEQQQQQQLLQRLAIQSDLSLSAAEKARRLQALEASLPAAEQNARMQSTIGDTVQQQTELLDSEQADPATRYTQRAAVWGTQAADRLAQLDQQRAEWQTRLDAYVQQSQAIRADNALSTVQQQVALQILLQQSFQGPELIRVQSMEQAGLLTPAAR